MSGLAVRLRGNKIRLPRLAFSGLTKKLMRGSLFCRLCYTRFTRRSCVLMAMLNDCFSFRSGCRPSQRPQFAFPVYLTFFPFE
jgi:hypothetical protein